MAVRDIVVDAFRTAIRDLVRQQPKQARRAGFFAVETLGKRLLSCPTAFAESWRRARQGLREKDAASTATFNAAERAYRQETGDDRETEQREATAATVAGAWLKRLAADLQSEIRQIDDAIGALGFDLDGAPTTEQTPRADARFEALVELIEQLLGVENDERLIVFTEYKTTSDYLTRRLRERHPPERILTLFGAGGMDEADREQVKVAFNDPASSVRLLIATDAASEGLNLHRTARYLLHYDCPWNPSRLEQRNGRIDRYGQGPPAEAGSPRLARRGGRSPAQTGRHRPGAALGLQRRGLHPARRALGCVSATAGRGVDALGASADAAGARRPRPSPLPRRQPSLPLDRAARRPASRRGVRTGAQR